MTVARLRRGSSAALRAASRGHPGSVTFPPGFFDRADTGDDARFYGPPRLVQHIDDEAIAAVGAFYDEVGVTGDVLDLMSSWVSHLRTRPRHLTVLGMNAAELDANPVADERVVQDLNTDPALPFADASFDTAVCTVSVDYLVQPVTVCAEVARVLRPRGTFALTFSNRCFPTKAVRGWLSADDEGRAGIVATYLREAGGFDEPVAQRRPSRGDPVIAVRATRI
jgi:SAM-dependent methyltransferase